MSVYKPKPLISDVAISELTSVAHAWSNLNWTKAMEGEYTTLINKQAWSIVPFNSHMNVIDNKWCIELNII